MGFPVNWSVEQATFRAKVLSASGSCTHSGWAKSMNGGASAVATMLNVHRSGSASERVDTSSCYNPDPSSKQHPYFC